MHRHDSISLEDLSQSDKFLQYLEELTTIQADLKVSTEEMNASLASFNATMQSTFNQQNA